MRAGKPATGGQALPRGGKRGRRLAPTRGGGRAPEAGELRTGLLLRRPSRGVVLCGVFGQSRETSAICVRGAHLIVVHMTWFQRCLGAIGGPVGRFIIGLVRGERCLVGSVRMHETNVVVAIALGNERGRIRELPMGQ
jgi:hypothetical protein